MYKHILVALDGSANAEVVLPYAEALASKFDSRVILLRATTPAVDLIPPGAIGMVAGDLTAYGRVPPQIAYDEAEAVMDAESKEAAAYLTGLADRLTQQGIRAQVDISNARASEAILRRAEELGADLIAMTTHGRSGLARALLGSVADEVVRRSNAPVLLVRVSGGAGDLPREGDTTEETTQDTVGGETNG